MANHKLVKASINDYEALKLYVNKCKQIIKDNRMSIECTEYLNLNFINSINTLGCYNHRQMSLSISKPYFEHCLKTNNIHDLENTIIHELLHCVAEHKQRGCGHTGTWKRYAQTISNNTNYKIQRCAVNEDFLNCEERISKKKKSTTEYKIICNGCGKTYTYHKMGIVVKNIANGNTRGYRCKCGCNNLKVI